MRTYTFDTVFSNCVEYFGGDEIAASTIIDKYLMKDNDGKLIESKPQDLIERLAKEYYRIENKYINSLSYEEIHEAIDHFKYVIPQGSPLAGIGNNQKAVSIGNCFVIGSPYDSWGGIFRKGEELSQIMKRRGGVGVDLSTLRPAKSAVHNAARTSDGVTCFMEQYSDITKRVAQSGRRGALMIALDCRHPDVESFATIKRDITKVTGANISIKWTDEFLECVERDDEFTLRFPIDAPIEKAKYTKTVRARKIWNEFVKSAHQSAEPGCIFWDTVINQSLSDNYENFQTIVSNPCGEIFMSAYNACILTVVNLLSFVDEPYTENSSFNFEKFHKYVRIATRILDDTIDLEIEKVKQIIAKIKSDPEPEDVKYVELQMWNKILAAYCEGRRIGLGITGLGDCLAALGNRYGSPESVSMVKLIMTEFHVAAMEEQVQLSIERGSFECWDWEKEKDDHYIKILPKDLQAKIKKYGRRNISITTCSPTGSVSMLAQTSSGIEPLYEAEYVRMIKMTEDAKARDEKVTRVDSDGIEWRSVNVVHKGCKEWRRLNPDKPIEESPYYKCEAGDIDWKTRVLIQSTLQFFITHSISSTVNLPEDVSHEEVDNIYMAAWKTGCKGITVYRQGSRDGVLLKKQDNISNFDARPQVLPCDIHYSTIEGNRWIIFVGRNYNEPFNGQPYEVFGGKKADFTMPAKHKTGWIVKNGRDEHGRRTYDFYIGESENEKQLFVKDIVSHFSIDAGSYTRHVSLGLRQRTPISLICETLNKDGQAHMYTFEKGISRVLKKYIIDGEISTSFCVNCKSEGTMEYREGCLQCSLCGMTKCE